MATSHRQAAATIRRLRKDRGWTLEDMSDEIFRVYGVNYQTSPRTIWRAEGGHKPGVRRQFAIATVLGTTPSMLWPERTRTAA
jgi:transcriptional regulator with XRE-family HTH domain